MQFRYALADRLHKSLAEVDAMTVEEYRGWMVFLKLKHQKRI